jgi:hypothetical protein
MEEIKTISQPNLKKKKKKKDETFSDLLRGKEQNGGILNAI